MGFLQVKRYFCWELISPAGVHQQIPKLCQAISNHPPTPLRESPSWWGCRVRLAPLHSEGGFQAALKQLICTIALGLGGSWPLRRASGRRRLITLTRNSQEPRPLKPCEQGFVRLISGGCSSEVWASAVPLSKSHDGMERKTVWEPHMCWGPPAHRHRPPLRISQFSPSLLLAETLDFSSATCGLLQEGVHISHQPSWWRLVRILIKIIPCSCCLKAPRKN